MFEKSNSVKNQNMKVDEIQKFGNKNSKTLKVIPLGGLEEIGKNCMVLEYDKDIIVIDMGFQFPNEDMYGVDKVLPDISYLEENKDRIKGIIVTHGHLDHIGGLPYLLWKIGNPVIYTAKFTGALIQKGCQEFAIKPNIRVIDPNKHMLTLGDFQVMFFRVAHNIPDWVGLFVNTPAGNIIHTGDFKFDYTPADGVPTDMAKLAYFGKKGILALFADSTNADTPGYTISEKEVWQNLHSLIENATGRIIITVFSSLISRMDQVIQGAIKEKRKVFLVGRSIEETVKIAIEMNYIKCPKGVIIDIKYVSKYKDKEIIILTTGSQGEEMSALTRMADENHKYVTIKKEDTVIFSSSIIPGNERSVGQIRNKLSSIGAKVIYNKTFGIHASGHAQEEDLKLMHSLIKPKYLVPIHGEMFKRIQHGDVAKSIGFKEENILYPTNGSIIEFHAGKAYLDGRKKLSLKDIFIDGKGIGDVGKNIIGDRCTMAKNGVCILVLTVDQNGRLKDKFFQSKGFVFEQTQKGLLPQTYEFVGKIYNEAIKEFGLEHPAKIKNSLARRLSRYFEKKIDRKPLVVPVVLQV